MESVWGIDLKYIGMAIRKERVLQKMTQAELAIRAGRGSATLSRLELGVRCQEEYVEAFAAELGLTRQQLISKAVELIGKYSKLDEQTPEQTAPEKPAARPALAQPVTRFSNGMTPEELYDDVISQLAGRNSTMAIGQMLQSRCRFGGYREGTMTCYVTVKTLVHNALTYIRGKRTEIETLLQKTAGRPISFIVAPDPAVSAQNPSRIAAGKPLPVQTAPTRDAQQVPSEAAKLVPIPKVERKPVSGYVEPLKPEDLVCFRDKSRGIDSVRLKLTDMVGNSIVFESAERAIEFIRQVPALAQNIKVKEEDAAKQILAAAQGKTTSHKAFGFLWEVVK